MKNMRKMVALVAGFLVSTGLAFAGETPEQDFLFLNDEAYLQEQWEVQVLTGFQLLKNKEKEREFELEDGEREEERESKRTQTLALPLEAEIGITDWWEMEVATEYRQIIARSVQISNAGTKDRTAEDHFGNLEYENSFRLLKEGERVPQVAAGMAFVFPTSDAQENELAHKRVGYEWGMLASKRFQIPQLPGAVFGHANVGFGVTPHLQGINKDLEDSKPHNLRELHYGVSFAWQLPRWWSFLLELRHEIEEEIELNRRVSESELTLLPGFSIRNEIADKFSWELGCGFPVGLTPDAEDWGFILQLQLEA